MSKKTRKTIATIDLTSDQAAGAAFASITPRASSSSAAAAAAAATPTPAAKRGKGNGDRVSTDEEVALLKYALKSSEDYRVQKTEVFSKMLREFCEDVLKNPIANPIRVLERCVGTAQIQSEILKAATGAKIGLTELDKLALSWDEVVKSKQLGEKQGKRREEHEEVEERRKRRKEHEEVEEMRTADQLSREIEHYQSCIENCDNDLVDKTTIQISQDDQFKRDMRKGIDDIKELILKLIAQADKSGPSHSSETDRAT